MFAGRVVGVGDAKCEGDCGILNQQVKDNDPG
jgi:hypothetical protein